MQLGGIKLDLRLILIILVVLGIVFVLLQNQQRQAADQAATQTAEAVIAAQATRDAIAAQNAQPVGGVQLGQIVSALNVDRDGCPADVTTRFAPDDAIFIVARETEIPAGTVFFVRLYREGVSIEDAPEIVADDDFTACINFVFENDQGFDAGNYEAEFFVNGNPAGSVAFTVR